MSKLDSLDPKRLACNPRASLLAWLKFEPIVIAAINQHPNKFTYLPTTMSPYSVTSKIRDAIRGKLAFDYPSPLATSVVKEWWGSVVVTNDKTKVYIGAKETKPGILSGVTTADYAYCFDYLATDELAAVELLLGRGRIKGPIRVEDPPNPLPALPFNVERVMRDKTLILL